MESERLKNVRKLFGLPFVLTIVITIIVSYLLIYVSGRRYKQIFKENVESFSYSYVKKIEHHKKLENQIMDNLNEKLIYSANYIIRNRNFINDDYLNDFVESIGIHNIWWFAPDGEVLHASGSLNIGWRPKEDDPIDRFIKSGLDLFVEGIRKSTEDDSYFMVVYSKDTDGYFVQTALDANYVYELVSEFKNDKIIDEIMFENDQIDHVLIIDKERNMYSSTNINNFSISQRQHNLYNDAFNGFSFTNEKKSIVTGKNVLEVIMPILNGEGVEMVLCISYSLSFYDRIRNQVSTVMALLASAILISFGVLGIYRVINPLSQLEKSINSFDVKDGSYYKPKKDLSVFEYAFYSLDNLSTHIVKTNKENKELHEEIQMLALTDYLTQLPNRRYLNNEMEKLINKQIPFSVIFIDIDNFKNYNDSKGHLFGDKLLFEFGRFFKKYSNIFMARYGGDEFILLYKHKSLDDLNNFISKIYKDYTKTKIINGIEINLDLTIGISLFPEDGDDPNEILRKADMAMYKAKKLGKNKSLIYEPIMDEEVKKEIEIKEILERAIRNDGFKISMQPQVNISSNEIISYEVLARLKDSNIGPNLFIPVAEKYSLVNDLGYVIINKAVDALVKMKEEKIDLKPVFVNISASQLNESDLVDYIINKLNKANIETKYFGIEVTESVLIDKDKIAIEFFEKLKVHGIKVSLDDFGSGNASINYLINYPVKLVKLDRSFSSAYLTPAKIEIYNSIIKLARQLDFDVIAEGIEEEYQIELLKKTDCEIVQGYYYFKPMELEEILELLKNRK